MKTFFEQKTKRELMGNLLFQQIIRTLSSTAVISLNGGGELERYKLSK